MKKITLLLLVVGLFSFGLNTTAQAQDTSVTLGLKVWYVKYELDLDVEGSEPLEYDEEFMYGPSLNIRAGNFFFGASYLMGSDFTYSYDGYAYDDTTYAPYLAEYWWDGKEIMDRTDLDFSVGYYIHTNFALFLGYKITKLEFDYEDNNGEAVLSDNGTILDEEEFSDKGDLYNIEYKGPVIGATCNFPMGSSGAFFFGTLSYTMLDSTYKNLDDDDEWSADQDVDGPAIEFGIGFVPETIPICFTIGYKYQKYEADETDALVAWEEIFSGFTLGIYYTF